MCTFENPLQYLYETHPTLEKSTKELMDLLSSGPVQRYIAENEYQDVRDLVLKNKVIFSIPAARLSEQIASRRKAKEKLPLYYNTPGIIYPPSENLEQSSSQATAEYKSNIMADVKGVTPVTCADLTGGFGVDTYFFSRNAKQIHYVEPQSSLLDIARHNHQLLGANNIRYHCVTAEEFLRSESLTFDFVFIDPSRRPGSGRKVHALQDSHPDFLKLKDLIFEKTSRILLKASPLLDIQAGIAMIKCVSKVVVVSVNYECKEVLFLCEQNFEGIAGINAINISGDSSEEFDFTFPEERAHDVSFSDPLQYLYEPNASILKAGAFKSVAARYNLAKISVNTHLYTGPDLVRSFPGRIFEVEKLVKADPKEVKRFFPDGKANVTIRNYPLSAEALKKKTGLKDGGEKFLIGFSGVTKKFLAVARRQAVSI